MDEIEIIEYIKKHPIYSMKQLLSSICDLLVETTGIKEVYTSPIGAGETLPRFFVFVKGDVDTDKETNNTGYKSIPIDIVYEQNYNLLNLYDDYMDMADKISEAIQNNLSYNVRDENEPYDILISIPLDAHDIKTSYNQDAMHCSFTLRLRVIDKDYLMRSLIKKIDWEIYNKVKTNGKN